MDQTGLTLSSGPEISDAELISIAQLADELGYHSLWVPESWGRDSFTILTMLACHTKSIRLATGIVNVYSRTPAIIAQSIASLDIISQGRAILGLGSSGRAVIEGWHGVPFDSPVGRTQEYIQVIRKALAGGTVDHQGRFFNLARFRMMAPPVQPDLPIYVASLGPKNLALTGELADGWLPIWVHRPQLPGLKRQITEAAAKAGRNAASVTAAPYITCLAADNPAGLARGEAQVRAHIAYYIGGMGSYYFDHFQRAGYAEEARAVRDAWAARDRTRAADAVTQRMVESVAIVGTPEQCQQRLRAVRDAGADMPVISFPHGADAESIRRTVIALAPVNPAQG